MLDLKKEFLVDSKKEIEGVWFDDFGEGVRIKLARIGNAEYQKELTRLQRPHRRAIRRGTLSDAISESILNKVVAKTIVLDWEGLAEDGVEIPYSYENCLRILNTYKDFRDQIVEIASEMDYFRAELDEEAEGNSESSSSGTQE